MVPANTKLEDETREEIDAKLELAAWVIQYKNEKLFEVLFRTNA